MNAEFCAGVGVRSITPTRQLVSNGLHCTMTVRFDEEGSPLNAKALALSFGGKSQVLIALDRNEEGRRHVELALRYAEQLDLDFPRKAEAERILKES